MNTKAHHSARPSGPGRLRRILAPAAGLLAHTVGGQAVMEGVMMRNKDRLAVAVRRPNGEIHVEAWPWFSLTRRPLLKKPLIRGFPVLLETMVNGIKALNFSAAQALDEEEGEELKPWHLAATLAVAILFALGLFVVVPHLFSLGMQYLGLGGAVEGLTFHLWDGLFKLVVFLGYIMAISLVPDIKRVFQYHGAEHKVIWAWEETESLEPGAAKPYPRLHPRCGTAFLLLVLSISIVLHAVLVPLLLSGWSPASPVLKHGYIVLVKLLLIVPISSLAYETVKFAGRHSSNLFCKLLNGPGLLLQFITTYEPDDSQIEVAVAALREALAAETAPCETVEKAACAPQRLETL